MMEKKFLRVEGGPQQIFEDLAPRRGIMIAGQGSQCGGYLILPWPACQRREVDVFDNLPVRESCVREPGVEMAVFAGYLLLNGVAADKMHHLRDAGLGIALADHLAKIIPSEHLHHVLWFSEVQHRNAHRSLS